MKRALAAASVLVGVFIVGHGPAGGSGGVPTEVAATPARPVTAPRVTAASRVTTLVITAPVVAVEPVAPVEAPVIAEPAPVACTGFRLDNGGYFLYWHADPQGGWRGPDAGLYTYSATPVDGCGYTPCVDRSAPPPVAESDLAECPWPEDHTKIPQPSNP